jgi:N-carbamoyl-L-amino-acid hydrolase
MISVNQERLWQSLMDMAAIGALPGGGCCRPSLSDADRDGRDLFVRWCVDAGCAVDIDNVGNIFARRAGRDGATPAIATGSHLDTQPHGGRFDGVFGVLAGLEVVRTLNDADMETFAPIDVINWTNEEGVRFAPPLTGSSAHVGKLSPQAVHGLETFDGALVGEELERIGYFGALETGTRQIGAFIEAHIEQGPKLEAEDQTIGVVEGIQGMRWYAIDVTGTDGHAGTVPMDLRRDALHGATDMMARFYSLAMAAADDIRATIGRLNVTPNSGSTIPGRVNFNIDLRHPDTAILDQVENDLQSQFAEIAERLGLEVHVERTMNSAPVAFDNKLRAAITSSALQRGYAHCALTSGAGHDAMNLALRVPTAMIFVPCRDGISHNEAEYASPSDVAAGANVLLDAMLASAGAVTG